MDSEIVAGAFNFAYNSWTWTHENGHRLCHCVRNKSTSGLFVDWNNTSLRGFVKPNETNYVMTTYEFPKFKSEKATLWYGSKPSKLEVDTVSYDPKIVTQASTPKLETVAKTSAPLELLDRIRSESELMTAAASSPQILQNISMKFSSSIDHKAKVIRYSCSYEIMPTVLSGWGGEYLLGFDDPKLNLAMFGTDGPVAFAQGNLYKFVSSDQREFERGRNSFVFSSELSKNEEETSIKSGLLKFYSPFGFAVAQLPVRYYSAD